VNQHAPLAEALARVRPHLLGAAAFSFALNLLLLVPALFMLQVFDRVLSSGSAETLWMLLGLAVAAIAAMAWLDTVRARLLSASGATIESVLGPRVLEEVMRSRAMPGAVETAAGLRDVAQVKSALGGPAIQSAFDAPWVVVFVAVIYLFDPLLGTVALLGALLMLGLGAVNERLCRPAVEAMQLQGRRASRFAEQAITNAETATAFGIGATLAAAWHRCNAGALAQLLVAGRSSSLLTGSTRAIRQLLQVLMLSAGAWLVISQQSTPGVMIAATILLSRALAPVEAAIAGWKSLIDAKGAWQRLEVLFGTAPKRVVTTALPRPTGALKVERVMFGFPGHDRPAIRQLTFDLDAGHSLAIVGPSASGKSTLARLLVGVWKPRGGAVRLDAADISQWDRERLGPSIGYLPQSVELFDATVAENIARMGAPDPAKVIEAAIKAQAHEFILSLSHGYDTPIGPGGAFLSGGQRQRIALARALYGNPALVVLDEPNSNLDAAGETALIQSIKRMKQDGVTLVIVTHRTMLLGVVDRVLVMRDGIVERFGTPEEILHRPRGATRPRAPVVSSGGAVAGDMAVSDATSASPADGPPVVGKQVMAGA
jgi:PrtD family type I secretion system ABC transporter